MTEMRAMRLDVQTKELRLETVPVPEVGYGDVLVRVKAAGVCLSDVHIAQGLITPRHITTGGLTLGHEVAGVVEHVGPGVEGWEPGARVAVQPLVWRPDGSSRTLGVDYDGGWAELLLTPASTLVPIPDDLAFEHAAIIPDAVSTPWSAIRTTGEVRPGEAVGVWGVGGLGAHAVQLLRLVGAAPIVAVDPLPAARERALTLGADVALDPAAADFADQLSAATRGRLLDVAIDFAGVAASQAQTISSLAHSGRIVLVGLSGQPITIRNSVDFSVFKHTIRGHFGQDYPDVPELIDLVSWGRLDLTASISDILPLAEAPEAVRRLDEKIGDPIRLILRP